MLRLTTETFPRPASLDDNDDPRVLYVRSYLLIRTVVGILGGLLPTLMLLLEWSLLKGDVTVRGSLSAYYFTPARDLFVGVLSVAGVLLLTYLAAQPRTWDFWLSSVAGVGALVVAYFPTERSPLPPGAPRCGPDAVPVPPGCTALQQAWGETVVGTIHYTGAAVFILSTAALCFVFARRDGRHDRPTHARMQRSFGLTILVAVAWALFGLVVPVDIAGLSPLYLGEVVALYAFTGAWLLKGYDLRRVLSWMTR